MGFACIKRFRLCEPPLLNFRKRRNHKKGAWQSACSFFLRSVPLDSWSGNADCRDPLPCHSLTLLSGTKAKGLAVTAQRVTQEARNKACCDRPGFVFASPHCRSCTKLETAGRGRGIAKHPLVESAFVSVPISFFCQINNKNADYRDPLPQNGKCIQPG